MTQPSDRKLYWIWRDDAREEKPTATALSGPYRTPEEAEEWAASFAQPGESSEVLLFEVAARLVKQQTVPRPPAPNGGGTRSVR